VQAILRALTEGRDSTRAWYEKRATDPFGLVLLGLVKLHQGDSLAAIETFETAEEAGETGLDRDLGVALLRAGRLE
jgi:hypothetical protein